MIEKLDQATYEEVKAGQIDGVDAETLLHNWKLPLSKSKK
jgi:hypothetical protein